MRITFSGNFNGCLGPQLRNSALRHCGRKYAIRYSTINCLNDFFSGREQKHKKIYADFFFVGFNIKCY